MPPSVEAVVDNDLLLKLAAYSLLDELIDLVRDGEALGVLGVSRYVVPHHLRRNPGLRDGVSAVSRFEGFLEKVASLEPTADEIDFATAIEEAATERNVELDTGESQLCAILVIRAVSLLLTGDKRAVAAIEQVSHLSPDYAGMTHRVVCLEQVALALVARLGAADMRVHICAEPGADKALSICFQCTRVEDVDDLEPTGLNSYIDALRAEAPTVLSSNDAFD